MEALKERIRREGKNLGSGRLKGDSFINLRRSGWTADQFEPGDHVRIVGHPSRDGSNLVEWRFITLADGSEIGGGDGQIDERLRILEERLAEYRRERGR